MMQLFYHYAISLLWLVWLVYWSVAAIGTKATRRREGLGARLLHIVPLAVGVGLLATPHAPAGWLAVRFLPRSIALFWPGFAFVAVGLGVAIAARIWLGGNWSGTVTLKQDHELIRGGPYRWVRHPIYAGLLLALLGSAMALNEWRGPIGVALITLAVLRKIIVEEQFLTELFGDEYRRFRTAVPALIPRPWQDAG
jgi:protein-S-isoprenylcysteine O-methyltransferase Ste14